MGDEEDTIVMDYHPYTSTGTGHPSTHLTSKALRIMPE